MRNVIAVVMALAVLVGCERATRSSVSIKDKSLYSKAFVEEVENLNYPEPIEVIDDRMIVGGEVTTFPDDLTLGEPYVFSHKTETSFHQLKVTRISHSTLRYVFELREGGKPVFSENGLADLGATFFLASQTDRDDELEDFYSAYEYTNREKDCGISIRIGLGRDPRGKLRAKVGEGCNDSTATLRSE